MQILDVEAYRPTLEATLARHSAKAIDLLIVPDIAAWSLGRDAYATGIPIARAIIDLESKGWGVLLQKCLHSGEIDSVLSRISWGGRHDAHARLSSPELFLRQLMLHEVAHLVNDWDQSYEDQCDDWAFEKLGEEL